MARGEIVGVPAGDGDVLADGTADAAGSGSRYLDWLLDRGPWSYVGAVLAISIVKYGVGLLPSWNYMQSLAVNWRDPLQSPLLQPPADFRLRTPVSAVAAGWLHLTGDQAFLALHLVLACAAIVVPFAMSRVRRSPDLRLLIGLLLVGGAIPPVLLSWIGSYDPVSLGAAAVGALAVRREVAFVAWLVFAFNNAPEAAFGVIAFAAIAFADGRMRALTRIIPAGAGAIVGYAAIRVVDHVWGGGSGELTLLKYYGYDRYVDGAVRYWPLIVVSALGVGWLLIFSRETWRLPVVRTFAVIAVVASIAVPLIALDETRITAGILWAPLLLTATLVVDKLPPTDLYAVLRRMAPVALLLVIVVVWDGSLVYAGWQQMADFFGYLGGHTPIPVSS